MAKKKKSKKKTARVKPKRARKNKSAAKVKEGKVHRIKIRIIGIGGGGGTIVGEISKIVPKADFWAVNTDVQALERLGRNCRRLSFGQELTKGLGTGSDSRMGYLAAKEAQEKLSKLFRGIDLCILISCLGGGTGSGAAPVLARLAKEENCLSIGVFTLPFRFEGEKRMATAKQSLSRITSELSASLIFPNEKIFKIIDAKTGFQMSLSAINSILANDLKNLINMIWLPGVINIDFADLKTVLAERAQTAFLASSASETENRAEEVCKQIFSHPLNDYDPRRAKTLLFDISSDRGLSIGEVNRISGAIFDLNPRAKTIFGVSQNPALSRAIAVTLLAVGPTNPTGPPDAKRDGKTKGGLPDSSKKIKPRTKKHPKTPSPSIAKTKVSVKKKRSKRQQSPPKPKNKKSVHPKPKLSGQKKDKGKTKIKVVSSGGNKTAKKISKGNRRRKTALDIHKEMESSEQERVAGEKKWDIPAFLRRQTQ